MTDEDTPGIEGDVEPAQEPEDDEWEQVNQAHYDRQGEDELVTSLVYAIADARDIDPMDHTEMPPLYESIDAPALEDSFFGPSGVRTNGEQSGTVSFRYDGCKVTLREDGWIYVYEPR